MKQQFVSDSEHKTVQIVSVSGTR